MNKIIREHYPASKLPNDLREGIDPASNVTVTIVAEEKPSHRVMTLDEIWAMRRPPYRTVEEINRTLRESRDEWDE
jgi:hypothetical protein